MWRAIFFGWSLVHHPLERPAPKELMKSKLLQVIGVGLSLACLVVTASAQTAANWGQWRGPGRDGVYNELQWPQSLSTELLAKKHDIPLGPSYSGPIVVGDRVFVTETVDKKSEVVKAIDLNDGSTIWSAQWEGAMQVPFFAASNGSWIRATPAYDDGLLYVAGMRDVLVCLDGSSGAQVWKRDFPGEVGTALPTFGFVSSPLVDGDFVYVQAGGGFQKLNKKTGQTVWTSLADGGSMMGSAFSSPYIATVAGHRQIIVQTRKELHGVDIDSGQSLWSTPVKAYRGMNIVTPTVFEDGVFLSTYGGTSQLLQISRDAGGTFTVTPKWSAPIQGYMTSPVIVNGHAYLMLRNQRFACFDLKTGEAKWRTKPFGKYASLIASGDQIMALDSRGKLILFKAEPLEFQIVDSRNVADNSWAHLAATKEFVVVRDLNALKVFRWEE